MKITKFNNFYQITFMPKLFPINCYVYEDTSSLTVIDMGVKSFVKVLEKLSIELDKPINKVVITHPHNDHIGGIDQFVEKFKGVEIVVSKRDALLLQGDYTLMPNESTNKIKGGFKPIHFKPTVLVSDGDYIGSLKVVETRGHTPGSISLFDENNGIMFVGDAIQVKGGVFVAGDFSWKFPFLALATWSSLDSLKSAKKIASLQPQYLCAGHGEVLIKPQDKLELAIEKAERKFKNEAKSN